jgi:putative phosphoribosyl transferase
MAERRTPPPQVVSIPAGSVQLEGLLGVPVEAHGIVIFAHGSGSGRLSPRNNAVAGALRAAGVATLLFDLLTEDEATDRRLVFDIPFLAKRLRAAADWVRNAATTRHLAIGYFGASTGAGAALMAAASDSAIAAIVSRGGRPDLAGAALARVEAPTLLIVGGEDGAVIGLNQWAYDRLHCEKHLTIVPGAGHLFEEPGTLERVVELAIGWYRRHLGTPASAREEQR